MKSGRGTGKDEMGEFLRGFFALLVLFQAQHAQAGEVQLHLDQKRSTIAFSGEMGSVHAGGYFKDVEASLVLDETRLVPVRLSYAARLSTVSFTEGSLQEQMILQTVASTLRQAAARFTSTSIIQTGPRTFVARGTGQVFGREYVMKLPFVMDRVSKTEAHATGVLQDRGKVLPAEVPGLSGEFSGVLKFDLLFSGPGGPR